MALENSGFLGGFGLIRNTHLKKFILTERLKKELS
jgi:hypothetical protein